MSKEEFAIYSKSIDEVILKTESKIPKMKEFFTNQNFELKLSINNLKKTYSTDFNAAIDKISTRVNKLFDKVKEINKTVQQQTEVINSSDINSLSIDQKSDKKIKILRQLSTMSASKYGEDFNPN